MKIPSPVILWKAMRDLGIQQVSFYALYQLGLRSGHYKRVTASSRERSNQPVPVEIIEEKAGFLPIPIPQRDELTAVMGDSAPGLLIEADEIVHEMVRLFGGPPVPLELAPEAPLAHWTEYELGRKSWGEPQDIKFVWEPARFGWVFTLGRAYCLSGNDIYAQCFWERAAAFLDANPPYLGPHWTSGQEVALRLIALAWGMTVFRASTHSTLPRIARLRSSLAEHARRIPPTLIYARSQNNNHLLSEAAGLYTAGVALAGHPLSPGWRDSGWKWFQRGIQTQIGRDGEYAQHSTNYHRLMLQLALWMDCVAAAQGQSMPQRSLECLASAVRWLEGHIDPVSGGASNLGANDGAYIFPLAQGGFADYRPVLQASAAAFLGERLLPRGPWDEMVLWLGNRKGQQSEEKARAAGEQSHNIPVQEIPMRIVSPDPPSWASLHAVHFTSRPSHADQLHVDLWLRGLNLALDAGTYLYNGDPPWDNRLSSSLVHNTITVDGQEQMLRAGRFLWLDWADAFIKNGSKITNPPSKIAAGHDGYRRLGIRHLRTLEREETGGWIVTDEMLPLGRRAGSQHTFRLQWLLPDWPWQLDARSLKLTSPVGMITLTIERVPTDPESNPYLVRAGAVVAGTGKSDPTWGWFSPTYGVRLPALSLIYESKAVPPTTMISTWKLPG